MNLIDYKGKLNDHKEYIKVINILEEKCKYIEIVVINGIESNKLIDKFTSDIIEVKKVSEWCGTKTAGRNNLYKLAPSKEFFNCLREYETFCKYFEYEDDSENFYWGVYVENTDFGIDDIAFFDKKDNCLLYTTTHEGYIYINQKLLH